MKNIFKRKCRIVRFEAYVVGEGWTLFREYEPDECIWNFSQQKKLNFPNGIADEGKLVERFKSGKRKLYSTRYSFYPAQSKLYIDRSDYAKDGFCTLYINDRYGVVQESPTQISLYDLEEVTTEPQGYKFRVIITA